MPTIKNFVYILAFVFGICLLVGSLFFYYQPSSGRTVEVGHNEENSIIKIDGQPIVVMVADTPELRKRGLSETNSLSENSGMLFVFPDSDTWGIWMKDMNYSLDILWIDQSAKIIHMEENITPESFPEVYQSSEPALYVLEVPAGFIANNNITPISSVDLPESL